MRKLIPFLLLASALAAQQKPRPKMPDFHTIPANVVAGTQDIPETTLESAWTALTGKLVWKHVHKEFTLEGIGARNPICWIENMTHPIPQYFDHDPRNLVLTRSTIDFDAPAGDLIFYRVGYR